MTEGLKQILSDVNWNSLLLIFLFGSAGGLTYWFYMLYDAQLSNAVPAPDFLWRWLVILPAVLMLGGFTALVGVFYITGNKPEDIPKAVVIAMVFGFSFNSVLQYLNESQSRALNLEQAENSTADLLRENARLKDELREHELPAASGRRSEELVNIRAAQADQVIDALRESTTRTAREKFVNYSRELILDMQSSAVQTGSMAAALRSLRSLGEIGGRAVRVSDQVASQAIETIATVGIERCAGARRSTDALQISSGADESLKEIARLAREEGRSNVAQRGDEARVELAGAVVRGWRDRFTSEERDQMREGLVALQARIQTEALELQLEAILRELLGEAAPK